MDVDTCSPAPGGKQPTYVRHLLWGGFLGCLLFLLASLGQNLAFRFCTTCEQAKSFHSAFVPLFCLSVLGLACTCYGLYRWTRSTLWLAGAISAGFLFLASLARYATGLSTGSFVLVLRLATITAHTILATALLKRHRDLVSGPSVLAGAVLLASEAVNLAHTLTVSPEPAQMPGVLVLFYLAVGLRRASIFLVALALVQGARVPEPPRGRKPTATVRVLLCMGASGGILGATGLLSAWSVVFQGGVNLGDGMVLPVLSVLAITGLALGWLGQALTGKGTFVASVLAILVALSLVPLFLAASPGWASVATLIVVAAVWLAFHLLGGICFVVFRKYAAPALAVAAGLGHIMSGIVGVAFVCLLFSGFRPERHVWMAVVRGTAILLPAFSYLLGASHFTLAAQPPEPSARKD